MDNLTAQQRFDQGVQHEIKRLIRDAEKRYDQQLKNGNEYELSFIESFSDWLDHNHDAVRVPESFEDWVKQNGDGITL